jgi:8-oxo-dGTP pyrophosphatase MutT (NUDIX family)
MMDNKRYVGVLVKCKDKVLLCKRNVNGSYPGMWSIPAGKLESEESTMEAAKREFYEETAIDIDNEKITFIGLIPRHTRDGKKIKGLMYVYIYEPSEEIIPDLENAIDGEEHTDCKYFDLKEIDPMSTGTYLHRLIEIVLEKQKNNLSL